MIYDNQQYWKNIHQQFSGLRAVGRIGLSAVFNSYKYKSEQNSFQSVLVKEIIPRAKNKAKTRVLDVGCGIGFWTNSVKQLFEKHSVTAEYSAMDISPDAVRNMQINFKDVQVVELNLCEDHSFYSNNSFDLIICNYVLHHITKDQAFEKAMNNLCSMVNPGGYLVIMDAILSRSYSPYYAIDTATYQGSGLSRPVQLIDSICVKHEMQRMHCSEPISYLLNNCLESENRFLYGYRRFIWRVLEKCFKNNMLSRIIVVPIFCLDFVLKKSGRGYSSKLIIYKANNARHSR
ncbi:MAG TPA: class I SAM-dependent methyltransferase [Bacteroidia bacterium]|nr:class I SAM-dependent methyltransferase [Bacteroidia bacterium]HNT79532.1 class I SAM-dependent methyltransferase [Bacteroidia bacterium]